MSINMDFAKKFAADKIIQRVLDYVEKNPEDNLVKIFNLLEKIAVNENQKEEIRIIKEKYNNNKSTRKLFKKLFELSPNYKKGLLLTIMCLWAGILI